jgi:hypothetical protein
VPELVPVGESRRPAIVSCRASIARDRTATLDGATPDALCGMAQNLRRTCVETTGDAACRGALTPEYEDYESAMALVVFRMP